MESFALKPLQMLVNRYLCLDSEVARLLEPLSGCTVAVEVKGLPIGLNMSFSKESIIFHQSFEQEPSVRVQGSVFSLLGMMNRKAGIAGSVNVTGDIHVAEDFAKLFKELDIDWEEQLSKIMGDVPGRMLGNCLRSMGDWMKQSLSTVQQNTAEFLQEELRYTPPQEEMNDFYIDVDNLRDGVERIEARISRLAQEREES